jgi:Iron-sulfur cluster binding domain of dihydroorotate dehydrogenase B
MHTGNGQVLETILEDGQRLAWIACPASLIPAAGQYLLASDASDSPLPVPLFYTDSAPEGFLAAPPIPDTWMPGLSISLRGPLGRGFVIPALARKIALIGYDDTALRLRGLIRPALKQNAAVVLVSDFAVANLSDEVEAHPLSAMAEVLSWADYAAFDVARVNLFELRERLEIVKQLPALNDAQILIRTSVPCGGVAECGVCAVSLKSGWQLACKDGPVFDLREI